MQFFINNTVNASLGPDSPTAFDPGLYQQEEVNLNLRVGYPISSSVHLAGGLEWRDEKFTIGVGQTESWVNGPFADQGFSAASNGFPGFSPDLGRQLEPQQLRRLRGRGSGPGLQLDRWARPRASSTSRTSAPR